MLTDASLESDSNWVTAEDEILAQQRWSTACISGPLALRTFEIFDETLGEPGQALASSLAEMHRATYEHGVRVAAISLALADECSPSLTDLQRRQLVVASFLHDLGKYAPDIMPLVDYSGYYTPEQRAQMHCHSAHSKADLTHMADRRQELGDSDGSDNLRFAADVSGSHHDYGLIIPEADDKGAAWTWTATTSVQIIDSADSLTAGKARTYLRARAQAEDGGRGPLDILDRIMTERFDSQRSDFFSSVTGLTPYDVVEISLDTKQSICDMTVL